MDERRSARPLLDGHAKRREQGRRSSVTEIEVHHNRLLVGLRLRPRQERCRVMLVGPDGTNESSGLDDRPSASRQLGS